MLGKARLQAAGWAKRGLMKKTICINIPCRNEKDNIELLCQEISSVFKSKLSEYDYRIQFIDNDSDDGTRNIIRGLCEKDSRICAIFNAKNFGPRSGFYGFLQTTGDCTINMAADFQEPVELIPEMVKEWENGAVIVCAVKKNSKENKFMFAVRSFYYKVLQSFSDYQIIEHFSGFGLYDKKFVDFLRQLNDPCPYIRGLVAEFGYGIKVIHYVQPKRKRGKSKNNFYTLFDAAMRSFTTYTKVGPRIATLGGFLFSGITFMIAAVYLILKLVYWDRFSGGIAPMIIGVFLIGSIQLFFIGFLGEYVLSINERIKNRPLVIEKERLNMEGKIDDSGKKD